MPQGDNTNTNKPNGTEPIKKLKEISQKLEFPTHFKKFCKFK